MKSVKPKKQRKFFLLSLFLSSLIFNFILINAYCIEIPYKREWLENRSFNLPIDPWFSSIEGDNTDVNASESLGQANYEILGDKRYFSEISGTPTEQDWLNLTNPAFPSLPDNHGIDQHGCWANHTWIDPDDPIQAPSIHWEQNITMPVDMSDYQITEASISAVYNASVTTSPGGSGSPSSYYGIDTPTDPVPQKGDYDTVRFYVLISDFENNEIYEIAWYQSVDLGQDDPEISNITDSFMNHVVEEALIFYLTSLFERDNFHFKITLGIRIKCIDNYNYDRDRWDSLRIKSCNLSFTYEKRINQFTSLSWNQEGDDITGENIQITGGILKFKYKIDQTWPTLLSPNSEIRVLLNNNSHTETIKLSSATTSFQDAKQEGFNVSSLILKDVDILLQIQIFLADNFLFNRSITISIDDASLIISYIEVRSNILSEPEFFRVLLIISLIAVGLVGTYFILYQRILKFPLPVRKVRKYRKTLDSSDPKSKITNQKEAIDLAYKKEIGKSSKLMKQKSPRDKVKSIEKTEKIKEIIPENVPKGGANQS
ncbi:MAG: hypothetical protein ACTSV5_05555 [Promethearchaeota archaeon]